jgi:hypothetical protein
VAQLDFKKLFKIERTKPFQRFVERKKIGLELWQYRGFLRKSVSLGRVTLKLDDLLEKAEVKGGFDVGFCFCFDLFLNADV